MNTTNERITVQTTVRADVDKVWEFWTKPEHIMNWNFASDDWCCPIATNDLKKGGVFNWRMESKDGSKGFDFTGKYEQILDKQLILYKMPDGRKVDIEFSEKGNGVQVLETFDAEGTNTDKQQRAGWQAILGNFKRYTESE